METAVLLVDDNAVQAATRQTILKREGFQVFVALSPARALEQIAQDDFCAELGLIITDHLMPGMNGSDFVRQLRRYKPSLPVLVISGLDEAEREYAGLGVVFRLKPLLPESLLSLVHSLISEPGKSGLAAPQIAPPSA